MGYGNNTREYRGNNYWAYTWESRGRKLWEVFKKVENGVKHAVIEVDKTSDKRELKEVIDRIDRIEKIGTFSPRPYKLGQHCDGSIDYPVLALFFDFCKRNGLNWQELMKKAYPDEDADYDIDFIKEIAEWQGVDYPKEWRAEELEGLIKSLEEINFRSLADEILSIEDEILSIDINLSMKNQTIDNQRQNKSKSNIYKKNIQK